MGVHWICDHYVCTGPDLHQIGGKMDIWIVGVTWFLIGFVLGAIVYAIFSINIDEFEDDEAADVYEYDDDEEDDDETNYSR